MRNFIPTHCVYVQFPYEEKNELKIRPAVVIGVNRPNKTILTCKFSTSTYTRYYYSVPQKNLKLLSSNEQVVLQPQGKYESIVGGQTIKKKYSELQSSQRPDLIKDTHVCYRSLQTFKFNEVLNVVFKIDKNELSTIIGLVKNYLKNDINLYQPIKITQNRGVNMQDINKESIIQKIDGLTEQQIIGVQNFIDVNKKKTLMESSVISLIDDVNDLSIDDYSVYRIEEFYEEKESYDIIENDPVVKEWLERYRNGQLEA